MQAKVRQNAAGHVGRGELIFGWLMTAHAAKRHGLRPCLRAWESMLRFGHMIKATMVEELIQDPIGSYPAATVACFDPTRGELPRRALDEARTAAYLEKLAAAGAPAVLIAASTGHGHLRTVDELEQWFRVAARARLGGTVLTALLRPEDGVGANRRLTGLLGKLGYAVAFVRPGRDLSPRATTDEVVANMRPVVEALSDAGLAVGLYSIPDVSGLPLTPDAAALLVAGPGGERIVAIKVTEANYGPSTLRFLHDPRLVHLKIVQGWDPHLAQALADGPRFDARGRQRCGVTSGPMSFAVFQYLHILAAAERGDWDEAGAAQAAVTRLFEAMQDDPTKFADLQRAKFLMGLGQPLSGTVSEQEYERVMTALAGLPRVADRERLARSLNLMGDGPFARRLREVSGEWAA
jgi:dihydrodipicolinate synthase/N-acetylneuraminate lyase